MVCVNAWSERVCWQRTYVSKHQSHELGINENDRKKASENGQSPIHSGREWGVTICATNWMWWPTRWWVTPRNYDDINDLCMSSMEQLYLATPFCRMTLPLCKWPCDGKPRSRRNKSASNICRPNRCTCDNGKHVDFLVYLRFHDSFHCDCEMNGNPISLVHNVIHTFKPNGSTVSYTNLVNQIFQTAASIERHHQTRIMRLIRIENP